MDSGYSTKYLASPSSFLRNGTLPIEEQDCDLSPIDVTTAERDFTALQYALFIALFIQVKIVNSILIS